MISVVLPLVFVFWYFMGETHLLKIGVHHPHHCIVQDSKIVKTLTDKGLDVSEQWKHFFLWGLINNIILVVLGVILIIFTARKMSNQYFYVISALMTVV